MTKRPLLIEPKELGAIVKALRIAADFYRDESDSAALGQNVRLADQFKRLRAEALALADAIAEEV